MIDIIFVNTECASGGIEVSLINLLNSIDKSKYNVSAVFLSDNLPFINKLDKSIEIITISRFNKNTAYTYRGALLYTIMQKLISKDMNITQKILFRILRRLEPYLFSKYIKKMLYGRKFDVSISYRIGEAAEVAFRSINAKKKVVFYHQGSIIHVPNENFTYSKAEKIVCVSNGIAKLFKNTFPEYSRKVVVVHNILCVNSIREMHENHEETVLGNDNQILLVSCGRLVPDKGFDLLIKACKKLKEKSLEFKMVIIGGGYNDSYQKELLALPSLLGIEDYVIFTGIRSNPYALMRRATIYIQPSRVEAFGLTIREAQILGCPVIATKTAGALELIEDGKTGIICDATPEDLYQCIYSLMHNNELLNQLSNNCREYNYEIQNQQALNKLDEVFQK